VLLISVHEGLLNGCVGHPVIQDRSWLSIDTTQESSWTAKPDSPQFQTLSYAAYRVMEKVCTITERKCLLKK
jgi:hypothetical protein